MKKTLILLIALSSLYSFAQDTVLVIAHINENSASDIYPDWGNMYGRNLQSKDGDEINIVCFVDPNLSNGYEDKTAPGALIGGGIRYNMTLYKFTQEGTCEKAIRQIDESLRTNGSKKILFEVSTRNIIPNF
jgi:hypothetical protein